MKNKSMLLTAVTMSTALIFSSCSNKTEEICDCLKKAANTYMIKGEKAKEHDLMKMCNQFEGALKGASVDDKRIVETCLDTVKKHIEDKVLFTDIEDVKLPEIPCGISLKEELDRVSDEKIMKKNKAKVMEYYLKNRVFNCQIAVSGATDNPYLTRMLGLNLDDDPKYFLVENGNLLINGYVYNDSKIEEVHISLLIPEKEKEKIRSSKYDSKTNQKMYRQIIKFTGTVSSIVENGLGELRPTFKVSSYEILSPDPAKDKAEYNGKPLFSYESKSITDSNEPKNENLSETKTPSSANQYKIQDPDGYSNLRKEPKGEVIKKVYDNETFEVIATEGDYKKIKLSDGTIGYIHSSRVVKAN